MSENVNPKNKIVAGVFALTLGMWGAQYFYLGNKKGGIITILLSTVGMLCFGIGPIISFVVAIIGGIKMLTCTDEEFEEKFVNSTKMFLM